VAVGRILLAWAAVGVWLLAWELAERVPPAMRARRPFEPWAAIGEAFLLTLFGALWFGSLGAGEWWVLFPILGALREWPIRSAWGAIRVARIVVAGALLAWVLPP
jgi:hypothetical protein